MTESLKNNIEVGDTVYYLKYAHKCKGTVTKINTKTYKIKSINMFTRSVTEVNINKNMVAHEDDICVVICDYKKDSNGMSVRFEYSEEYNGENKPIREWAHQPANFISVF